MKFLTGMLCVCSLVVSNCKPYNQISATSTLTQSQVGLGLSDTFQQSVDAIQAEPNLNLDNEYTRYKDAIAKYKQSSDYTAPQTDEDRAFNYMIDNADSLTKDDLLQFVKDGKFTQIEKKLDNLDDIAAKADVILAHSSDLESDSIDTGTSFDTDQRTTETETLLSYSSDSGTQASTSGGKTSLQKDTSIFFIVMGSLVLVAGTAVGLLAGQAVDADQDAKPKGFANFEKTKNPRLKGALAGFGIAGALVAGPLVVGSLIVSDSNPSIASIRAAQGMLALIALVPALAAARVILRIPKNMNKKIAAKQAQIKSGKITESKIRKSVLKKSGAKTLVFAGISAGLAAWSSQLGLASTQLSPKDEVSSQIARFPIAAAAIERKNLH